MKRIETEYGVAYVGEPEELETFDNGRLINGEITKPVGDNIWVDSDKFKISGVMTCVIALGFLIGGFIIGLMLMGDSTFRMTGFVTIIILGIVLRVARKELIAYESAYLEMMQIARQEELSILMQRKEAENRQVKILNAAKKAQAEVNKETKQNAAQYAFTSNDFDDAAQSLLIKPVKEARKHKTKVTGQGLITTMLKGIR